MSIPFDGNVNPVFLPWHMYSVRSQTFSGKSLLYLLFILFWLWPGELCGNLLLDAVGNILCLHEAGSAEFGAFSYCCPSEFCFKDFERGFFLNTLSYWARNFKAVREPSGSSRKLYFWHQGRILEACRPLGFNPEICNCSIYWQHYRYQNPTCVSLAWARLFCGFSLGSVVPLFMTCHDMSWYEKRKLLLTHLEECVAIRISVCLLHEACCSCDSECCTVVGGHRVQDQLPEVSACRWAWCDCSNLLKQFCPISVFPCLGGPLKVGLPMPRVLSRLMLTIQLNRMLGSHPSFSSKRNV